MTNVMPSSLDRVNSGRVFIQEHQFPRDTEVATQFVVHPLVMERRCDTKTPREGTEAKDARQEHEQKTRRTGLAWPSDARSVERVTKWTIHPSHAERQDDGSDVYVPS
jgi:hypothetical protein